MIIMTIDDKDRHGGCDDDGEYDDERDHVEKHCGVGGGA